MAVVLTALSLLGLGIFGPGIANGFVSGGPQLAAGAAVGTVWLSVVLHLRVLLRSWPRSPRRQHGARRNRGRSRGVPLRHNNDR